MAHGGREWAEDVEGRIAMGRRSRRFVDRRTAATYALVSSDFLRPGGREDGDAPTRTWMRVDDRAEEEEEDEAHVHAPASSGPSDALPWSLRREILSMGLPDDGYDYSKHLRETGGGARTVLVAPHPPRAAEDERAIDARRRKADLAHEDGVGEDAYEVLGMRSALQDAVAAAMDAATRSDVQDVARAMGQEECEELQDDFVRLALREASSEDEEGAAGALQRRHEQHASSRRPRRDDDADAFEAYLSRLYASDSEEERWEETNVPSQAAVAPDLVPMRPPTAEEIEKRDARDADLAKTATRAWLESRSDSSDVEGGLSASESDADGEFARREAKVVDGCEAQWGLAARMASACKVANAAQPKVIATPIDARIRISKRSGLPARQRQEGMGNESNDDDEDDGEEGGGEVMAETEELGERRKGETIQEKKRRKAAAKEIKRQARERKANAKAQQKHEKKVPHAPSTRIVPLP